MLKIQTLISNFDQFFQTDQEKSFRYKHMNSSILMDKLKIHCEFITDQRV